VTSFSGTQKIRPGRKTDDFAIFYVLNDLDNKAHFERYWTKSLVKLRGNRFILYYMRLPLLFSTYNIFNPFKNQVVIVDFMQK
jgi:hypothetical protein